MVEDPIRGGAYVIRGCMVREDFVAMVEELVEMEEDAQ